MEKPHRYWIAINGDSCALSILPWRDPITIPVAQALFGFSTLEEALHVQHVSLTAPPDEVKRVLNKLRQDVEDGRVIRKLFEHPEPPTRDKTAWMEER